MCERLRLWVPFMATDRNSDPRGTHPEFEPPDPPRSAAFLSGDYKLGRFVSKMAEIIETEFGIRALQAALVERRNKDRVGHIFCHLRLIIVPGGVHKGRGGMRASPAASACPGSAGEGWAEAGMQWREAQDLEKVLSTGRGQRGGLGLGRPE